MPDYFELFGLPRRFDLDAASLQSRYLELARRTHPDFAGSDPDAQLQAMERSAQVNEAHRILADPEERANYLLEFLGGPTKDQDKSLPEGFLEEMVTLREELAEAQESGERPKIEQIRADAQRNRQIHLDQIRNLFAAGDLAPIRREINALRYIHRLLEQT